MRRKGRSNERQTGDARAKAENAPRAHHPRHSAEQRVPSEQHQPRAHIASTAPGRIARITGTTARMGHETAHVTVHDAAEDKDAIGRQRQPGDQAPPRGQTPGPGRPRQHQRAVKRRCSAR